MSWPSLLFPKPQAPTWPIPEQTLRDLRLDLVVEALGKGYEAYDLEPLYRQPLTDVRAIAFRQGVARGLLAPGLREAAWAYVRGVEEARALLLRGEKCGDRHAGAAWFALAATRLLEALEALGGGVSSAPNPALAALGAYAARHLEAVRRSLGPAAALLEALSGVRFELSVRGDQLAVGQAVPRRDLGLAIRETFARFQGGAPGAVEAPRRGEDLNHVESAIIERVARLHPDLFSRLHGFRSENEGFLRPEYHAVARELLFYLRYLDLTEGRVRSFPEFDAWGGVWLSGVYELALSLEMPGGVVANDVLLEPEKSALVITGPNHGGKTTLARAIGQVFVLGQLGLPVPASRARIPLVDGVFTVFERGERGDSPSSRLEAELLELHRVLTAASASSLVILNEVFSSTPYRDALELGREIDRRLSQRGVRSVWVTFLDPLSRLPRAVSLVGEVDPQDPSVRTYRFARRDADGKAHAMALARKYGLTYEAIRRRLG